MPSHRQAQDLNISLDSRCVKLRVAVLEMEFSLLVANKARKRKG